jgi:DNA-binding transcriptional ArsR family regulator
MIGWKIPINKLSCQFYTGRVMTTFETPHRVSVLSESHRLAAVLSPIRRQVLQSLDTPDSATGIARRLGLARQKVNYHLRELERAGFVEMDEQRQRRGCVERLRAIDRARVRRQP